MFNQDSSKYAFLKIFGEYGYGWHDSDAAGEAAQKGIDESVVRAISADKGEPEWMLEWRLDAYRRWLTMTEQTLTLELVGGLTPTLPAGWRCTLYWQTMSWQTQPGGVLTSLLL